MTFQKIYQELKKKIPTFVGKKCPDFDEECFVCQAYQALDYIKDLRDMEKKV